MSNIPQITNTNSTLALEVAEYLVANGIGTQMGTDVFVGHFSVDPDQATMVFGAEAAQQEKYLDTQYTVIDVWCRSEASQTAECEQRAYNIFQLLHQLANIQIGANFYLYYMNATSNIQDMDRDNQARKLLKVTFRAMYRDTNGVS